MRNLKRALSLTLASVMLLGMMVVGSSAAAGYDDVKETDNVEAIEVLQTVGIMVGDERGFGPDRPVNRAEMAVVMGLLLNLDYNYYTATCPFNDVYDWARGWVGACAANGIVSGRGDGVYDPGATVTAVEASSMLMRALGYFKYSSDYADGFEVSTVRQGTTIGIFDGVGSSATEPMTRNQVAQMVLNTLQSGMVRADGNTLNYFDTNGQVIATSGKVNYVYVTSREPFATAISSTSATSMGSVNDNPIVELGEQLYNGELKLRGESQESRFDTRDVFERPARVWEYQGKEIGTYVKKELLKQSYTDKVTGQMLYDLLGKNVVDTYRFVIAVDGVEYNVTDETPVLTTAKSYFDQNDLYRTNKDGVGDTGKGVLTEVYVDTEYKNPNGQNGIYTVYINIINTYLAKAKEDYDTKDDDVRVDVFAIDEYSTSKIYYKSNPDDSVGGVDKVSDISEIITIDGDDFDIKDVKEKDLFLVRVADGEIQEMVAPEIVSDATINAFSRRDWVNLDGNKYDYASTARYDTDVLYRYDNPNLKDITYNVILDKYGYAIGLERNEDPDQYVFLTGIEDIYSNLTTRQVDANVIHLDGTMATVKVNMKDSFEEGRSFDGNPSQANTWCTYRIDSNNVYTLEEVHTALGVGDDAAQWATDVQAGDTAVDIDQKHITLPTSLKVPAVGGTDVRARANSVAYGNDKTVYLNVELDEVPVDFPNGATRRIIDDVTSVVTGHRNVKISVDNVRNADASGTINDLGAYVAPVNEIYTLYDDDNYIIAVVTIGEDEGISSNWVYVNSKTGRAGVSSESYNGNTTKAANDGKWTWTREVILNGKKTEIKEVGSDLKWLDKMVRGDWYEVKYDADGNVRRAESLTDKLNANDPNEGYVDNIETIKDAVTEKDTVLFSSNTFGGIENLEFNRQGTLYVKNDVTKGFAVAPDVKVVLALASKTESPFDDVIDTYEGYDGLRDALNDMNIKYLGRDAVKADWDKVELNAILVNNSATVIVINDKNPAPNNKPGTGEKPVEPTGQTVTFDGSSAQYGSDTFYKNNVEVKSADESYMGGGKYSFTVKEGDTVEIYNASTVVTNGKNAATDVTVDGVTYTVSADGCYVTFKVGKNSITLPEKSKLDVAGEETPAGTTSVIDKNIVIAGDYKARVTGAHVLAKADLDAGGAWNGVGSLADPTDTGKLYVEFTLPDGATAATPTLTFNFVDAAGNTHTEQTTGAQTLARIGTTNKYFVALASTTQIGSTSGDDVADLANGGTLTITPANPIGATGYALTWDLTSADMAGINRMSGTTTGNIADNGSSAIAVVLSGFPTNVTQAKLTYSVSGLKDTSTMPGAADADGNYSVTLTVNNGTATSANLVSSAAASGPVKITLIKWEKTAGQPGVSYKGGFVDEANAATSKYLTGTAGSQTFDFVLDAAKIPAGASAVTVTYTATGLQGVTAAATVDVTANAQGVFKGTLSTLTATGDVELTITKVAVKTYKLTESVTAGTTDGIVLKASGKVATGLAADSDGNVTNANLLALLKAYFDTSTATAAHKVTFTITGAALENGANTVVINIANTNTKTQIDGAIDTAVGSSKLVVTGAVNVTVTME